MLVQASLSSARPFIRLQSNEGATKDKDPLAGKEHSATAFASRGLNSQLGTHGYTFNCDVSCLSPGVLQRDKSPLEM